MLRQNKVMLYYVTFLIGLNGESVIKVLGGGG